MIPNPRPMLEDFAHVATLSGFLVRDIEIRHEVLRAPHQPPALPSASQAVYVFSLAREPGIVLKVGKVGANSNARFQSQHYNPESAGSNLAKSLIERRDLWGQLGLEGEAANNIGIWIREHTDRDHFFMTSDSNPLLLALLEVFLQCRLKPIFEG
jgi:hypothetical protein